MGKSVVVTATTSQTTPCSGLREPKAVGVRVYSDAHRLLQRCACQLARQCTFSTAVQRVLHAASRFVAAIGPRDHITPTLISLHWLPVRQRITCAP